MESGRLEVVPNGTGHLDTVRALHQTVVSLRTALEVSKNELKQLKEKYQKHSHCLDYTDVIEKLTIENHILRRKIIDSGFEEKYYNTQNIKLQVTYSPRQDVGACDESEVVIKTATTEVHSPVLSPDKNVEEYEELGSEEEDSNICSADLNKTVRNIHSKSESAVNESVTPSPNSSHSDNIPESYKDQEENVQEKSLNQEDQNSNIISSSQIRDNDTSFKTKLELLSKFDVRIKVRTIKEGTVISSTTSDSDSTIDEKTKNTETIAKKSTNSSASYHFEEKREHFQTTEDLKGNKFDLRTVSTENIKMAVPNEGDVKSKTDKFDVQVKITSEENLVLKEITERNQRKDTLNLDVDDLSLRSFSEGDNSVFSEGVTPVGPCSGPGDRDENSENDSEEVDDIELIFTTDESKDMSNLQEDLVSIRESEHWAPTASAQSTPVLIKFHTLDPDFQPGADQALPSVADSSLKMKRVSLPNDKEIRHVAFNGKGSLDLPGRGILKSYDNKSDTTLFRRSPNVSSRRLDSVDSLSCDYRGLSFDNTKSSSFELGSSLDVLQREESVDSFHKTGHFGHRFSVFAETDISKCGISEEDLTGNLNIRRNTCPNPFQYRLPILRGGRSIRPVLRESSSRRSDGAAQTDVTAIPPPHSRSDQYLAGEVMSLPGPRGLNTAIAGVPRGAPARYCGRRATLAMPPHSDAKRLLLSDIGFTSMVPELSRSADPLWRAQIIAQDPLQHHTTSNSTSTAKFMSRNSSYRSPCLSLDRSCDYIPQCMHFHRDTRAWRSSLPDVRRDDTVELLHEADVFLRRSIDNLHSSTLDSDQIPLTGTPYIPSEPRQLRLGHIVKVITPHGRIAVGRVRYVGLAGGQCEILVGVEMPSRGVSNNDGTHRSRRYFLTQAGYTAMFLPFNKVVMAWAN